MSHSAAAQMIQFKWSRQSGWETTMRKHILASVLAAGLVLAGCRTPPASVHWEYRVARSLAEVNELAGQGWTVVGFSEYAANSSTIYTSYLLKRSKP